jgi:putative ABC transport system permease protein
MHKLFGAPLTTIAIVMLVLFSIAAIVVVALAFRNRIMFKLGVRNIPKRPAQTALIVLGLMLSTVLITAAFSTGDTLVYTIRSVAVDALGNTDEIVTVPNAETAPNSGYFDDALVDQVDQHLSDAPFDGILPVIQEQVPLFNPGERLSAPSVTLFAPGPQFAEYTKLTTTAGNDVSFDDLASDEGDIRVFIDNNTAEDLKAEIGDQLLLFVGSVPTPLKLAGIVEGASSGSFSFVLMPLDSAQSILNKPGQINAIYISNTGGALDGAKFSDEIEETLKAPLEEIGFRIETVKKDTLDAADMAGTVITSVFVLFGLFSVAAGVLLIFLIFMMLAAARKSEMGMARAVGTKRNQLIQMFLFEGIVYDVMAAIVGVGLGVLVTYALAGIMASVIPQDFPIEITVHVEPTSLIVAFTLGMLVTFATVALSAWKVSRLNIVRAIRDIPEPVFKRVSRSTLALGVALGVFGLMLSVLGMGVNQAGLLYLGVSLIIIGLALIARWRGARERPVFTIAGVLLVAWSLLPTSVFESIFGEMTMGMEMFFLVGITMVLGAIWAVSYNLDVILRILVGVLGRVRGAAPILRAAMAYPMKNRMRTGLTMAMFSVVIFSIVFMSVIIRANTAILSDTDSIGGGYDVNANVSYINTIPDIEAAMADKGFDPNDFQAVAGMSTIPLKIRQVDAKSQDWEEYIVNGGDNAYLETNDFEFLIMAQGYESPREVWLALRDNPGLAVISADAVPSMSSMGMSFGGRFMLEGIDQSDKDMSPVEVQVRRTIPGVDGVEAIEKNLTIIAVLKVVSFNYGVYTSQQTVDEASPFPIPITTYLFKLSDGVDAGKTADHLELAFLENGMQAVAIKEQLKESNRISYIINSLLTGFMGLGLVVGIAALGVISTRAVVERRHEIGILRAIGFRRSSVQAAFLLESSIVASLGIIIGSVLALALSYQVLNDMKDTMENLEFQMPWMELAIIAGVSWVASMLMTIIPARQASKIYPAEALRYE